MWRHYLWRIALIGGVAAQGCALSPPALSPETQAVIQSLAQRLCDPCSTYPQHEKQPLTKRGCAHPARPPETSLPAAPGLAVETDMGHEP